MLKLILIFWKMLFTENEYKSNSVSKWQLAKNEYSKQEANKIFNKKYGRNL